MAYSLHVTEHAQDLLDDLVYHLLNRLCNRQAAGHLVDMIDSIYDRLEDNPMQFPVSKDQYLAAKGYREAIVPQMDYVVIFSVQDHVVNVVGIFHQLEDYRHKA